MGNSCMRPPSSNNTATASDCPTTTAATATTPFNYIKPGLTLTDLEIDHFRSLNFHNMLKRKKLHLVLDLDETLVEGINLDELTKEQRDELRTRARLFDSDTYEINDSFVVNLRPGVPTFLEHISSMFELWIYTLGSREYARKVSMFLDPPNGPSYFGGAIRRVICNNDCTTKLTKGLDVVLADRRMVLILDDRKDNWMESDKGSVITIRPYSYFDYWKTCNASKVDTELIRVFRVLKEVHKRFYKEAFEGEVEQKDVGQVVRGVRVGANKGVNLATKVY